MQSRTKEWYATTFRSLRARGVRVTRTIEEAYRLGVQRDKLHTSRVATLCERYHERLVHKYVREIARRGGEVSIRVDRDVWVGLCVAHTCQGLTVLHVEGWRYYSRRFGARRASLAYLCGRDDNGPWAVRVPGSVKSVHDALAWVTPAIVARAQGVGKRVLRQGDVYAVETTRDRAAQDARTLRDSHQWDAATRTLRHTPADGRAHADLVVPFLCRLVQQRVYRMGRTTRRGAGD